MANGLPFLVGTERLKGSHSMSGYHSMELCYLAAVYTNLLNTRQHIDLHFKPKAVSFPDGVLRVSPDLLPPGSVRLTDVWVDDQPYGDFDAEALTVKLPAGKEVRVKVRITSSQIKLDCRYELRDGVAWITLRGSLDADQVALLDHELRHVVADRAEHTVLDMSDLTTISHPAVRELIFIRSKLDVDDGHDFYVLGAASGVASAFREAGEDFEHVFRLINDASQVK